jgi:hypothetical protein
MTSDVVNINYEVSLYSPANTKTILESYFNFLHESNNANGDSTVQIEVTANYTLVFYDHVGHVGNTPEFEPFRSVPVMRTFISPTNGTISKLLFSTEG